MSQPVDIAELIADVRESVLYFRELGITNLDVKLPQMKAKPLVASTQSEQAARRSLDRPIRAEATAPAPSRLLSLPSLISRRPAGLQAAVETILSVSHLPEPIETIGQIRDEIGANCTRCKLYVGRTQVVNSIGNFSADLMFVGEAPGADEDLQGKPFVGRAGQLLTKIIEGIGFKREDVFIGNINRCRPPHNRAPEPDETALCKPFLKREIAVVRPRVIVVLGATAAQNLLETKASIGKLRGQFHDYLGVKVMPTFHPAYLLRDPHKKREVWEDMKMVRDYLE